jgi:Concanavalin A-like lectin/glucanases superfamily
MHTISQFHNQRISRRARRGVSIILVLALVSMTLALSYAMLRTQATVEQASRSSNHRVTARMAATTGMSAALRSINDANWRGVDSGLSGDLGGGATYAVRFETGDASLAIGNADYNEFPYRMTITSTGVMIDPANPQVQATHQIQSVVQLVRRKLADAPGNWPAIRNYTVYQWGTDHHKEVDIEAPVHIEGPVFLQNKINYLADYPSDGDDKPFDGTIDEVAIFQAAASASDIQAIHDGTLTIQTLASLPAANPVAWWRFDEASGSSIAIDELGSHNGRYEGSRAGGSPSPGLGGSGSAVFDGFDDHVDIGPVDVNGSNMTILAWIKADDFEHSDGRIISKATGSNTSQHYWMLSTFKESGDIRLRFRLRTAVGGTDVLTASSEDLEANDWIFVAAVYDGTKMRLYKDGHLVGSRSKVGAISTNSTVRASIGNNPSGSPRARLLRDYEAMRVAGHGDFRPFSGPISAPLSMTSDHNRRLLEDDSNVTLNDVAIGHGVAPVTHPGNVSSYQLYPGGKVYVPTRLPSRISNSRFTPDPKTNPLGLVTRSSNLTVDAGITVHGTLIVSGTGESGRIKLKGNGISLEPVSLPPLYGDSTVYQLPSMIAFSEIEIHHESSSSLRGLIMTWDELRCQDGKQSTTMQMTGQLIAGKLTVESRDEWDQSSSWWNSQHTSFLGQLDAASPTIYFPQWLDEQHDLDVTPRLTIQPDSAKPYYHWHDWTKPIFVAHPDDGGLRWDLLKWQDIR